MKYGIGLIFLLAATVAFSQSAKPTTVNTDPLCVVDGKILPATVPSKTDPTKTVRAIDSVDPQDIDKINVLNGAEAISAYGDAGKNGVILITLKKKKLN